VAALLAKAEARAAAGQLSNADNMAVVGVLSTQLLVERLVNTPPDPGPPLPHTLVDRA
jgi:asparagine synthase (glutamine-hydrolysing)